MKDATYDVIKGLQKAPKQPIKDIGKETIPRVIPRNVQAIENAYEFFTKQKPISWQYYSKQMTLPFYKTGTSQATNEPIKVWLDYLDVNEVLVVNHLSVSILYRPYTDAVLPATDWRPGHYVPLEATMIPTVDENIPGVDLAAIFSYNLLAEQSALYESNAFAKNPGNVPVFGGFDTAERDGFTQLNTNVLENGDSGTSLYILETGRIGVNYTAVDSYEPIAGFPFAFGFLPPELTLAPGTSGIQVSPKIVFDVRGHKLNKNDGELLKALIKSTPPT